MKITESRANDILHWLDDEAGNHALLFEKMTLHRDAAALIRQLQAELQAAWHAGLDEGREQGRRNRLAEAATRKRELDSAGAFHFSDNGDDIEARIAQQPAAAGEESSKGADVTQPKRRPYDPSGSLSEYGVFPECDAQQPADDEVVFIDGVGAGRSSIKSCRDGVQWIMVGDRVYWPLSDSDAKRLQSACCGNGSFDGLASPAGEGDESMTEQQPAAQCTNETALALADAPRSLRNYVAALQDEIEALRVEVAAQRTRADAMAGEAIKHEARAERLEEALRGMVDNACAACDVLPNGTHRIDATEQEWASHVAATDKAIAALHPTAAQEAGRE